MNLRVPSDSFRVNKNEGRKNFDFVVLGKERFIYI